MYPLDSLSYKTLTIIHNPSLFMNNLRLSILVYMRLLEYEAKRLLKKANLPVPSGTIITNTKEHITTPVVLKSQVPVGGRGKLGGVKIVDDSIVVSPTAITELLTLKIKGYAPTVLLAEEKLHIRNEHYISLFIDRASSSIQLMVHKDGGVEVESNSRDDFLSLAISKDTAKRVSKDVAAYLGYSLSLVSPFITRLLDAFIENDAILLEINPLVLTEEGLLICGDCKMELDDAAAFRHPDWQFEDTISDTNFVVLNKKGAVATIANGAGLAMATVDAVSDHGMVPANFLDVGGGANTESVLRAFRRILEFSHVEAIIINIFAGITRCDEVAKAIIAARNQLSGLPPLFIRLAGTNFEEAVSLLTAEDIPTLATLEECLEKAQEVVHG